MAKGKLTLFQVAYKRIRTYAAGPNELQGLLKVSSQLQQVSRNVILMRTTGVYITLSSHQVTIRPRQRQTARRAVPNGTAARMHSSQGRLSGGKSMKNSKNKTDTKYTRLPEPIPVRAHTFKTRAFLSKLAAELVDKIVMLTFWHWLGDRVLNERDHLALDTLRKFGMLR
ncbi:hypothetical protein BDP27DRAFT_1360464 [Rhodocollybia butyracea]|uniref:Uncharacterized protein n=1 Tax=Rhodocollybia butyracea TaxID=206335 RepID=A0A9P5Q1D6_9AGAR|nr:hypothetical protein BDP27DRAFT_1360464 [Rhodocollybia butyracea]